MKKIFILLILLILLLGCAQQNVTVDPDFVAIPFPQDRVAKDFPTFSNKVFEPGTYLFPATFFTHVAETGISTIMIQYQIDDNIVLTYINPDPRDQGDHRVKFKDGTALSIDFKTAWGLKKDIETGEIDIRTLLSVLNKLTPENNKYTIMRMWQEYAADLTTNTIRAEFKNIKDYSEFSTQWYSIIGDKLVEKVNARLPKDCPIVMKSALVSNDTPEEITKSAMVLKSAIQRDIDLIKEIGPYLEKYPAAVAYLQLKFAENNASKIGNYNLGNGIQ